MELILLFKKMSIWILFQKTNDEAKKTGIGKTKKINEFESLCIDFVRAAKGH